MGLTGWNDYYGLNVQLRHNKTHRIFIIEEISSTLGLFWMRRFLYNRVPYGPLHARTRRQLDAHYTLYNE